MGTLVWTSVRPPWLVGCALLACLLTPAEREAQPPIVENVEEEPVSIVDDDLPDVVEELHQEIEPAALLDRYDALALELMNGSELSDRQLQQQLMTRDDIGSYPNVYRLREHERLIGWEGPPPKIRGGGGRASVFVRDGSRWRKAGHVDSAMETSYVWLRGIDAEQGIAYL